MYAAWDFFPPTYSCPWDIQRVGRLGDGGKWICGMSKYELVASRPLIIYSFGVGDDSSFEAEMLARTNTEIYAFDFTTEGFGPEVLKTDERAFFEKVAISGNNSLKDGIEFRTLSRIMGQHGHEYVDIVKMDIEGDEYAVLTTLMDEYAGMELPIGQLLVEFHHFDQTRTVQEFVGWWDRVEGFGMRPAWCEANLITITWETGYPCCAEYVWINTNDKRSLLWA
ncbi:hypothetical protein F4779DRAFT_322306 [Xylariaceae sp. FL0662B]|nr:hypothetical protein F4779DRAFT_322306 [Xylariaceae sp. FL0662B]